MRIPPLPAGLIRGLALVAGATSAAAAVGVHMLPMLAGSDLASAAALVGGCGIVAWAAAQASRVARLTLLGAFGAGLALPAAIPFLLAYRGPAANDNDQSFKGSWPQFISE